MTIKQRYRIKAHLSVVWDALINKDTIESWGGGPALISPILGENFSLWGGDIHGKITNVISQKLLSQEWFYHSWKNPSHVSFYLSFDNNETQIDIIHDHIPDNDVREIEDGWKNHFIGQIKRYLEDKKY